MKSPLRQDFQHVLWMGISTGGNALLGFIGGVLLVRGLRQDEYGLVSSAIAMMLIGQELVGRGINDSMVRLGTEAVAGSIERSTEVFRAGIALKMLFFIAALGIVFGVPGFRAYLIGYPELRKGFPAIMAAIAGFGVWSFNLAWYQARLNFRQLSLYQPVNNLLKVLLLLIIIRFFTFSWTMAIWIMAISFILGAAVTGTDSWVRIARLPWYKERFLKTLKDVWRYASWNMLGAVAFVAYSRMDIFILSHFSTTTDLAIYNVSWQTLTIIDLGTITLMTVMIPKVCHCLHYEDMLGWAGRSIRLGVAAAAVSLPLFFLADWYIPLLYGPAYRNSVHLVKIMYWGNIMALLIFPLVGILYARNAFRQIAVIQVFLFGISIPAYFLSAGHKGIVGVAWTTFGLRVINCAMLSLVIIFELRNSSNRNTDDREKMDMDSIALIDYP